VSKKDTYSPHLLRIHRNNSRRKSRFVRQKTRQDV